MAGRICLFLMAFAILFAILCLWEPLFMFVTLALLLTMFIVYGIDILAHEK